MATERGEFLRDVETLRRRAREHYMANGIHAQAVAAEFLEHANEEQGHADRIAIDSYREMVRYFGDADPTTRVMMEGTREGPGRPARDAGSDKARLTGRAFYTRPRGRERDRRQRHGGRPGTWLAPRRSWSVLP